MSSLKVLWPVSGSNFPKDSNFLKEERSALKFCIDIFPHGNKLKCCMLWSILIGSKEKTSRFECNYCVAE